MREINKNIDIVKMQKVEIPAGKNEKSDVLACPETEEKCVNDFSNPKAEALGRSQVSKTDNLKTDVDFAISDQKAIESSDKLFEMAYKVLVDQGDPEAYEKASSIATSEDSKAIFSK